MLEQRTNRRYTEKASGVQHDASSLRNTQLFGMVSTGSHILSGYDFDDRGICIGIAGIAPKAEPHTMNISISTTFETIPETLGQLILLCSCIPIYVQYETITMYRILLILLNEPARE